MSPIPFVGAIPSTDSLWLWESANHSTQYASPKGWILWPRSGHCYSQRLGTWHKKLKQKFSPRIFFLFFLWGVVSTYKIAVFQEKEKQISPSTPPPCNGSLSEEGENKIKAKEEQIWVSFGSFYHLRRAPCHIICQICDHRLSHNIPLLT